MVQQLADAAITLLKGDSLISKLDVTKKTALLSIGLTALTPYQQALGHYFTNSTPFYIPKDMSVTDMTAMLKGLKCFDQIIVGIHDTRLRPPVNSIQQQRKIVDCRASQPA